MPAIRVPLVGTFNTRGLDGDAAVTLNEDQRFLNATFNLVQNPVTQKSTIYVEKRPGWGVDSIPAAGSASTGMLRPQSFNSSVSAFGNTNSTIYFGTTSIGTITGRALHFTETLISGLSYVAIRSSDGTGWYYVEDSHQVTVYTADGNNSTTITDIKIAGVTNTAGLYPGQKLTAATNITAGTRVVSVNAGAFTAVLDTATTGGAFNDLAITKEPIAKIIDADFVATGTAISAFAEMDGYLFYADDSGYINNSDLNSVASYTANARIAVQMSPDPAVGVARHKNTIIVFGGASKEVFFNAGLASGSPLQRSPQFFERIGCLDQLTVTTLENEIFFVSTPHEGDIGVYRIRDLQMQRISTPNVDRVIGTTLSASGSIYASSFRLGGYPYAAFALSTSSEASENLLIESGDALLLEDGDNLLLESNPAQIASFARQMVYNAALNLWSEWDSTESTFIDGISSGYSNQLFATSRFETGGKVYTINPAVSGQLYQDDGSAFTLEIRTSKLLDGPHRKFIEQVTLIGWDANNTTMPYLSYSDDDYATFSTARQFTQIGGVPTLHRCGSHRQGRAYKITDSANVPFRAEALGIRYSESAF